MDARALAGAAVLLIAWSWRVLRLASHAPAGMGGGAAGGQSEGARRHSLLWHSPGAFSDLHHTQVQAGDGVGGAGGRRNLRLHTWVACLVVALFWRVLQLTMHTAAGMGWESAGPGGSGKGVSKREVHSSLMGS